jgi:thiol:disulfide interchange protein DsbC
MYDMRVMGLLVLGLVLSACAPDAPEPGTTGAVPAEAKPLDQAEADAVRMALAKTLPGTPIDALRSTPLPGVYEIQSGMNFGYVSADGRFLIEGDLNDLVDKRQLTEDRRKEARVALMKDLGEDQTIEFAPAGPAKPKYTVTVFTDVDCGYCRMLHQHIKEYNDDGIAVRYVFFPRSGPNTDSFYKAERVWCAADRRAALTQAKATGDISGDQTCANPVMNHLRLANALGLRGTPGILLPDGELIPGYQPPARLLKLLTEHEPHAAG